MGFGTRFVNRLLRPNVLIAVFVAMLIAGAPLPQGLSNINQELDRALLSAAVDFVDLPSPTTPVTVIHVPDVEYEAWLADIAGADALLRLIEKAEVLPEAPGAEPAVQAEGSALGVEQLSHSPRHAMPLVLGLIAEEPLSFIQGRAEKLLGLWSENEKVRPEALRTALRATVTDREVLMATLRQRAVVGMEGRLSHHGELAVVEPLQPRFVSLPSQWARWLWPLPSLERARQREALNAFSAPVEHLMLSSPNAIAQPLLAPWREEVRESFVLRLLRVGDGLARHEQSLPLLPIWRQGQSLVTADYPEARELHVGFDGSVVPYYGDAGIHAPTMQLTLAAAQRAESLSGWVLLGRDDSQALRATAQALAAVGDRAYAVTPAFFPPLKIALLLALVLWALFVLPRAGRMFFCVSGLSVVFLLMAVQVLLPSVLGLWLPLASVISATAIVYSLSVLARIKRRARWFRIREARYWALQAAQLNYRAGNYDQAVLAIQRVPLNAASVKWYYRIASALLDNNAPQKALPLWRKLYKKARDFRDVKQRINQCESALLPPEKPPEAPEKTQVVCVTANLEKLGRYQVRSVLGHGGSGVVYQGYDPVISRDVALKTLNLNVFSAENQTKVKDRFLTEVKTIGKLSHPNIVSVYDVGQQGHWAYIAMDLARGMPLTEYLNDDTLLPIAEVYWIGLKVAEALTFAHQQNIVHCDIKPGNIIYDRESQEVKVTDFGIAKWLDEAHTETGEIMGSPLYMAPEQLQGRPVTEQTD
ncbi:MAG TPA: serine/threonine-protein kinase, partial [Marinagarivorans sp.]